MADARCRSTRSLLCVWPGIHLLLVADGNDFTQRQNDGYIAGYVFHYSQLDSCLAHRFLNGVHNLKTQALSLNCSLLFSVFFFLFHLDRFRKATMIIIMVMKICGELICPCCNSMLIVFAKKQNKKAKKSLV